MVPTPEAEGPTPLYGRQARLHLLCLAISEEDANMYRKWAKRNPNCLAFSILSISSQENAALSEEIVNCIVDAHRQITFESKLFREASDLPLCLCMGDGGDRDIRFLVSEVLPALAKSGIFLSCIFLLCSNLGGMHILAAEAAAHNCSVAVIAPHTEGCTQPHNLIRILKCSRCCLSLQAMHHSWRQRTVRLKSSLVLGLGKFVCSVDCRHAH